MNRLLTVAAATVLALTVACESPEERAADAQADMTQKRMELADDYQECTKQAAAYEQAKKDGTADRIPSDEQKTKEQCDEIMKMMEALK